MVEKQETPGINISLHEAARLMDGLTSSVFAGLAKPDGAIMYANRQALDAVGSELHEVLGKPLGETPWLAYSESARVQARRAVVSAAAGVAAGFECPYLRSDGRQRVLDVSVKPAFDPEGGVAFLVLSSHDVTERKEIERLLRMTHAAIDEASVGVLQVASDGRVYFANRSLCNLLGYADQTLIGMHVNMLSKRVAEEGWDLIWTKLQSRQPSRYEAIYLHADGRQIPVEVVAAAIKQNERDYVFAFVTDLTERKQAEKHIHFLAHYDPLTGMPNRASFVRLVDRYIAELGGKAGVAVLIIDLERFWSINQSLGRQRGDQLLTEVADRLLRYAQGQNRFARLGADQFAVVIAGVKSREEIERHVKRKVKECFAPPYHLAGQELRISARFGIALSPEHGGDAEALMKRAEAALIDAKRSGERSVFYAPGMSGPAAERLQLENRLRRALEREEFVLHYQPKVAAGTREVRGLEALLRWRDPEAGLVAPAVFMGLLEQTGMIVEVGEWVLRQALLDRRAWEDQGLAPPRIAVNVSGVQLRKPDFLLTLARALTGSQGQVGLDLEITESVVMEDMEGGVKKLLGARAMGFELGVDDFGTGFSSLAYLTRLPVQQLKIDRSFVCGMLQEQAKKTMVDVIISLAHSLQLKVIAEGVETEAQAMALEAAGCDQMQGYLFGRPMPAEEVATLLARAT